VRYDGVAKQRSRVKFRKHIKAFFKRSDFSKLKVLCFSGEEALEVKEVYDKLGFCRPNITILERDVKVFNNLKRTPALSGCRILNTSFGDFVGKCDEKFDVLSLDFMGQIISEEKNIFNIYKADMAEDRHILLTNFCGARDAQSTQALYKLRSLYIDESLTENDLSVSELRKKTLPSLIYGAVNAGSSKTSINKLIHVFAKDIYPAYMKYSGSRIQKEKGANQNLTNQVSEYQKLAGARGDENRIANTFQAFAAYLAPTIFVSKTLRILDRASVEAITFLLQTIIRDSFFADSYSGYKYVSQNGMPMLLDVFTFKRMGDMKEFLNIPAYIVSDLRSVESCADLQTVLNIYRADFWIQLIESNLLGLERLNSKVPRVFSYADRVDLGSEASLKTRVKLKSNDDIRAFIRENPKLTTKEISALSGISLRKISANKAWVTMGK
jgi:hypothetical protein